MCYDKPWRFMDFLYQITKTITSEKKTRFKAKICVWFYILMQTNEGALRVSEKKCYERSTSVCETTKKNYIDPIYFPLLLFMFTLSSFWIKVNVACWLKLWLGSLKCRSACGAFCLLTSLRWLFNLVWNYVSNFTMCSIQQVVYSISYINSLLLQLISVKV